MAKILHLQKKTPTKLGFKRVKKRRKKDPEGHGQLNMFAASKESSARIVNLSSKQSPFEQALLLDERNDSDAFEMYRKAISEGECVADAYCNLGILESNREKRDKAFDCFTKSLKQDPRHLESHYNLANLYFDMDNLRLARQHYEIAAEIEPKFPNIYFNLGLVEAMDEKLGEAFEAFTRYKNLVSEDEGSKADELIFSLKQSLASQTKTV